AREDREAMTERAELLEALAGVRTNFVGDGRDGPNFPVDDDDDGRHAARGQFRDLLREVTGDRAGTLDEGRRSDDDTPSVDGRLDAAPGRLVYRLCDEPACVELR